MSIASNGLDKNRLARRARGMHDSLHLALLGGAHGDDEAIVAQRDVVLSCIAATGAQNAFQCFPNRVASVPHAAANAPKLGRGVVADLAIGENSAADGHGQRAQIRNSLGPGGEKRKFCGNVARRVRGRDSGTVAQTTMKIFAQPRCRVRQCRHVKQHRGHKHRRRRIKFRKPTLRVGQRTKAHLAAVALVGNRFGNQSERSIKLGPFSGKCQSVDCASSGRRTGSLAAQQFAQPVKFENVFRGARQFCVYTPPDAGVQALTIERREIVRLRPGWAPGARAGSFDSPHRETWPALDLADAIENRLPEISQDDEGSALHGFFIEHFPDDGQFY